jgi:2-amino-4-hydroxy-6-hydroxymethyldihydropteridine diphosphokinase
MGDSRAHVLDAIERLQELSTKPLVKSSLWLTEPVDCPPGSDRFVNAIVGLTPFPGETPETLLSKLRALENEFGRRPKKILNESRPLDLDLIAFGSEVRSTKELTLPHPRAHLRGFILQPLAEIAPAFVMPTFGKNVGQLLEELPPGQLASVTRT